MNFSQAIANRIRQTVETQPRLLFTPSPALAEFMEDDHPLILVRAANRVGKTRHAAHKAASYAIENPNSRVRCVGPTRNQANKVLGRYLSEFLVGHLDRRSYYRGDRWNTNTIMLANGSIIEILSLEDNVQAHAGDEFHLVVMDEVPTRAHFTENLARIGSLSGQMIIIMTPVDRPIAWFREVVEGSTEDEDFQGLEWRQYVAAFSADNCPWYTDEQVERHLAQMRSSMWQWAQRVEGAWEGVSDDRMLDGFTDDSVVTADPEGVIDLALSFDHGVLAGKTVALLWAFKKGRSATVVDEWIADKACTPEEVAQQVDRMLARHGFKLSDVAWGIGDINASGYTGASINKELETAFADIARRSRAPFRIRPAAKGRGSVHYGIRLLNYAFLRREVKIHERCRLTIDACKHWQGGKTGDDGLLSDRIDALRYGAVAIHGGRKIYARLQF